MEISISEIHEILTQAAANEESLIAALEEIQARVGADIRSDDVASFIRPYENQRRLEALRAKS